MDQAPLDLWPDELDLPDMRAPAAILRGQASLLGMKTKNIVEAEVTRQDDEWEEGTKFIYRFRIVAPALGGYRYLLFSIKHDVNFYPLEIELDEDLIPSLTGETTLDTYRPMITAQSETHFIDVLRKILGAKEDKAGDNGH